IARKIASPEALKSMPPIAIMIISSVIESIIVGVIVAIVIPIGKMGKALTKKANARPGSPKFNFINSIPFAVINGALVSAIVSFISVAQAHAHIPAGEKPPLPIMWFGSWLPTLPLSIIVGYVFAIILAPIVAKAIGLGAPPSPEAE
ncbi:MAG: hypothetical protein J6I58_03435, partial [Eubacterium sp.]|nr:hypothetical protein [Eubacterium sp.]